MTTVLDADTGASGGRGAPNAWSPSSNSTNWAKISGSAPTISISASELHATGVAAAFVYQLGSGTAADAEAVVRFKFSSTSDIFGLVLRETASNTYYYITNSASLLKLNKVVAGTITAIGVNFSFTFSANTFYWYRMRVVGTTIYARVWADGNAEPSTWGITVTDSAISAAGGWGIRAAPNAVGDTLDFDSYQVLKVFSPNTETQGKYATQVVGNKSITQGKFLTSKVSRTTTEAKFTTSKAIRTAVANKFITSMSIKSLSRSKFYTRMSSLFSSTRSKFYTRSVLLGSSRSRFYTQTILKAITRDKFYTRTTLKFTSRSVFIVGLKLYSVTRSTFKNNFVLISRWYRLRLASVKSFIRLSFVGKSLINLIFGDPPMAQPNTTIQVNVTALNASNIAITNLSALTCVVTFPDGSVSPTLSLGNGVVNSGGGVYTAVYTTKSPGVNNELWTATDALGDTAQYLNKTFVTY